MKIMSTLPSCNGSFSADAWRNSTCARSCFARSDGEHALRRIDADHLGVEPLRQRLREATRAAAQIDDQRRG